MSAGGKPRRGRWPLGTMAYLAARGASLLALPLLANALAPALYGRFYLAFVLATIWGLLAQGGLTLVVARGLKRELPAELLGEVLAVRLALAALIAAAAGGWAHGGHHTDDWLFFALLVPALINACAHTWDEALAARGRYGAQARAATWHAALLNLGLFIGCGVHHALRGVVAGQLVGALAWAFALGRNVARVEGAAVLRPRKPSAFVGQLARPAAMAAAIAVCAAWGARADLLVAHGWLEARSFGHYAFSLRLLDFAQAAALAVIYVAYPLLARAACAEDGSVYRKAGTLLRAGVVVLVPVCLVVGELAPYLLHGLWYRYFEASPALGILIWGVLPTFCAAVVSHLLLLSGRGRDVLAAQVAGLLTSFGLAWWWAPIFGSVGAAAAHVCAAVMVFAWTVLSLRRVAHLGWTTILLKPAGMGLAMAAVWLLCVQLAGPWLWLRLFLSLGVYNLQGWLVRPISIGEWAALKGALRRRPPGSVVD
jgi:O-antigen/teichoic acid export membrane protein